MGLPVRMALRAKKIRPTNTIHDGTRRLSAHARIANGRKVYFVSSPAAVAAEAVVLSSSSSDVHRITNSPASGQSTSDQPAVMASAGVVTIAAEASHEFVRRA